MYRLILCLLLLSATTQAQNPQLVIEIQNIEGLKGNIRIGIFNKSEKFLKEGHTYKSYIVAVKKPTQTITIEDLPKGEYAFLLYHDKNSDAKLNQTFIGIPKEPFAFSNNIIPKLSKPSFEECKFMLKENKTMKIKLGYYNK